MNATDEKPIVHREIERKFLVCGDFRPEISESSRISQGYLCSSPDRTVRIRVRDDQGYITVKGRGNGISRFEWEKPISAEDARQLLELCEPSIIDKTRHLVPCADGIHTWEVDEFYGDNEGLVMAEIELGSEDETFPKPEWLGREVTFDPRFHNSSLRRLPYKAFKNTLTPEGKAPEITG